MGREAVCVAHWQGQVGEVKVHLDSTHLELRGKIRADIPRDQLQGIATCPEGVRAMAGTQELLLEFNAVDRERWVKALLKTPPTLAQKLGVGSDVTVYVSGVTDDAELDIAIAGATAKSAKTAGILMAVVMSEKELIGALRLAERHPGKHIWMVYEKGKAAVVGDAAVRALFRENGFIDSKSCAVSARLTATRYRKRVD